MKVALGLQCWPTKTLPHTHSQHYELFEHFEILCHVHVHLKPTFKAETGVKDTHFPSFWTASINSYCHCFRMYFDCCLVWKGLD